MTRLRRASLSALHLAEALRDALPEIADPDEKQKAIRLTSAIAQAQGWLEVLDEKARERAKGAS